MAQQLLVSVQIEKNDNVYQFIMPVGAPLGEAYDACFDTLQEILNMAKQTADKMKQNENGEVVINAN